MEKIIQLRESEYNELVGSAQLNEKEINDLALKLWEEKGIAEFNLNVNFKNYHLCNFKIDCSYYFYKDKRFFIPEELRARFREIIENEVLYYIERKFGEPVKVINEYNRRMNSIDRLKTILYCIAASGWAVAAIVLLFMTLL